MRMVIKSGGVQVSKCHWNDPIYARACMPQELVEALPAAVNLPVNCCAQVAHNWEDNFWSTHMSNLELGKMSPRSKHYGVKHHWIVCTPVCTAFKYCRLIL